MVVGADRGSGERGAEEGAAMRGASARKSILRAGAPGPERGCSCACQHLDAGAYAAREGGQVVAAFQGEDEPVLAVAIGDRLDRSAERSEAAARPRPPRRRSFAGGVAPAGTQSRVR